MDRRAEYVTILTRLTAAQSAVAGAGALLLLLVLFLNCIFKIRRWRALQVARSGLITPAFLTLTDLPRHAYQLVAEEAMFERKTTVVPKWKEGCGWGAPSTQYDGVHFKTFIGSSLHILEAHALKIDTTLSACPAHTRQTHDFSKSQLACDVDKYLQRIRLAMNGELDDDLCKQYIAFYRKARRPGRECTEQEFRSFVGVFQEILRRVER